VKLPVCVPAFHNEADDRLVVVKSPDPVPDADADAASTVDTAVVEVVAARTAARDARG